MGDEKKSDLLELCDEWYNRGGMTGFENEAKKYNGTKEEIEFLSNLRGLLRILNSSGSTRVFGFGIYSSINQLIDITICRLIVDDLYIPSVKDEIQKYKEFFANTLHQ